MATMTEERPALISAKALARMMDCSERMVWQMNASGRMPELIRLGRAEKWRLREIEQGLADGAPSNDRWEATRRAGWC